MSELLPSLNTLVQIFLPGEEKGLASRVEGVGEGYLDISAPPLRATMHLDVGSEMDLFWRDKRGMYKLPTQLEAILTKRHRLWRVQPTGLAEKFQRRRFTRAEVMLDVEIDFINREPRTQVLASAIDMSEGGVRCRASERLSLQSGEEVELRLTTEGKLRTAEGSILRKDRVHNLDEFVVILKEPVLEPLAKALRREVFRAQRAQRRTERESQ